jgi:hypothetical protein
MNWLTFGALFFLIGLWVNDDFGIFCLVDGFMANMKEMSSVT